MKHIQYIIKLLAKLISISTVFFFLLLLLFCSLVVSSLVARIKFPKLKSWLLRKEVFTTPKKNEQKRKKIKPAVLRYYNVDENGKISHFDRLCPSDECGAGVFTATTTLTDTVANVWSTSSTNQKTSNNNNKILASSWMWTCYLAS